MVRPSSRLLPPSVARTLPSLRSTEGRDPLVLVKLFDPCGRWTLYVTEYDPEDRLLYGFCRSPLGPDCDEYGYSSLDEIEETMNRLGLQMERDLYWMPVPLSKVQSGEVE